MYTKRGGGNLTLCLIYYDMLSITVRHQRRRYLLHFSVFFVFAFHLCERPVSKKANPVGVFESCPLLNFFFSFLPFLCETMCFSTTSFSYLGKSLFFSLLPLTWIAAPHPIVYYVLYTDTTGQPFLASLFPLAHLSTFYCFLFQKRVG